MKALRSPVVTVALVLAACATGVNEDIPEYEGTAGSAGTETAGGMPSTAGTTMTGSSGTYTTAGTTTTSNPFGGTGSTAGAAGKGSGGASGSGSGGATTAGSGGKTASGGAATAGSGGKASGGTGGKATGGSSSGGTTGTSGSGGSGGSVVVGEGSCTGTMAFAIGTGSKYAMGAKVTAVCMGGTPCTKASPAGTSGKTYEFSCLDQYNCGSQDPGTTNWSTPPWQLTKACAP